MTNSMYSFQLWMFLIASVGLCNSVYTPLCRDPDMGGQLGNRFSSPNSTGLDCVYIHTCMYRYE
jgi:hypothetical protein